MKKTGLLYLLAIAVLMAVSASPSLAQISITGVGAYALPAVEGLSGITYAGGNQYYAADDSGGFLCPMTINVNSSTGAVSSASFGTTVTLSGRTDMEGIAYAGSGQVYVSDETGATITKYNVSGGNALSSVAVPAVYSSYRSNYSLESLTMRLNGLEMWTANEEALYNSGNGVDDGPLSTTSVGTIVRLQKFTRATVNDSFSADGQWAYQTEPIDSMSGGTDSERSGVSDLCVLPNGKLLVLERQLNGEGFGGLPEFENHIYEVDFAGADDVSGITSLNGATYDLVSKTNRWEADFGMDNFEGLCLGQELDNGDYSLLMISDGDGNPNESLYALRISGEIPEPATISLLALGGLALIRRKKRKV